MISRKSDSIQRRFTLGSAMVITVILVTFSVLLISYNSRAIKKDLHAQLNKLISFSQTSLGSALWQYNYDYIRDYLDSLFLYEDLIYVSVTNKDIEIRKTNDSEFNDLSFAELRASAKFMVAETTVLFQNQEVGTVRIALSRERENHLLIVSSSLAIIMLLIMNVAVFGTNLLLSRRYFFTPLSKLEATVRLIAHGNLDASIDVSSKDEIGQVARSFKQMMENLKEITSSRDDLNKEVYHRKRAEEDLREEKERLRLSLDAAQAGTWTWDNISGKVSWDEQMHHIFGMAPGTFAGTLDAWRERIHPDDAQDAEKAAIAAMQQGTTFEKEYRVKSSSGEWKIITAHAATLMDENGIPLKMSGFAMDITKRRRAETELLEKHLQLQAILDHAPALISIKDMNGTVILANRNFEVLDIPPLEEFIGKNIFELFPEEVAKSLWENDLKAIETEGPIEAEEVVTHKDGTQHTYLTIKFPLYFENRKPFGICAISTEITERKKLESKLLQAQKMESIGNLAGGIAHDFNNILSAIIGFTELALGEAEKDSTQESDLKEVQAAGNRAKELVKQILAFARKSEEKLKPVRPSDSIENTLKLLRPSTPTSIQIITNINSSSMIMANPSQMEQIVLNLCTNSIHAMQNHGDVLEIGLRDVVLSKNHKLRGAALRSREYIEISVTDTGPGIEPNTIDNIFEPYFTTKEVGEGTGMGLAMVKGTVENWGGEITVKSEPHKKTTFKILLPISTNIDRKTSPHPESYSLGTEHILFVDDEPPIARMGSRILESLGYTVTVRTSSIEALELFKNKSDEFDLVMSDMTMPFMTGDELSIEIRKIKPNIPIIICTGYSNKLTDEGAKLIGINAFTYKPFTKSDFAKTVRAVLEED